MVRIFGPFVGLGFCMALLFAMGSTIKEMASAPAENPLTKAATWVQHPRALDLSTDGPFGRFDQVQLQRGLKVYKEVCSACHGLGLVSFRDLGALGYDEDQVKALAAQFNVPSINPDTGEPASRPGLASDRFPSPYPNEVAARAANNNAYPPDLSLIVKAREGHEDYVYSLLTGYRNPPANLPRELQPSGTLHYNPWFANLNIAMAPPLTGEGQVTYDDGTPATVDQMAEDVSAFLLWTAEPKLQIRHQVGWAALGFLLIFMVLTYMSYRAIWADKKGH